MKELGEILQTIFSKISDFFDILDLSFLVSGLTVNMIVCYYLRLWDIYTLQDICETRHIVFALLLCYISGLITFAGGRFLRSFIQRIIHCFSKRCASVEEMFYAAVKANVLESHPAFSNAVSLYEKDKKSKALQALYVKFWAIIREKPEYKNSYKFLQRYWVMSATYDGLSMANLVFFILSLIDVCCQQAPFWSFPNISLLLLPIILGSLCIREANRYSRSQVEEIIATIIA